MTTLSHRSKFFALAFASVAGLAGASQAALIPLGVFENSSNASLSGLNISLNITQNTAGTVDFVFGNTSIAPNALASIDDLYFENTAFSTARLSGGSIFASSGSVNFGSGASPGNVPGGANISFSSSIYTAGRNGGASNGVGPGDSLTIRFNLISGTFNQFVSDWQSNPNAFRVSMHVQRLGSNGDYSVSAVSQVPSPGPAALLATGMALISRRRRV